MQIEIQKLECACIVLAEAIEDGKISGVTKHIKEILGYKKINKIKKLKKGRTICCK